jgi:hypothetical protein
MSDASGRWVIVFNGDVGLRVALEAMAMEAMGLVDPA